MPYCSAMENQTWRKCSTCKKEISFLDTYYVCNVSTCNRKRTGLVFCTVQCWDAHLPIMNHRTAWSEERKAPSQSQWEKEQAGEVTATKGEKSMAEQDPDKQVLVVVSKLKGYIKAKSGFNTSGDVLEALSDKIRNLCDDAIIRARQEGRKTVMARDF